ncbi:MAG TPA: hypothetical protein VM802_07685 [Chitinophaga sp.]|uniref:hypothetical protein n=1 Tax=Chitinophaga sp. TaxID=1869181 RepID=UPI002B8FE592|nr:hypothetical protein [Chitinophaga sp.]HVI44734.1 hypothetical protein [Chitinophaga sp.]
MTIWTSIIWLVCLLLLIVLLVAEARRTRKRWLAARLLATTVTLVCLAMLISPVFLPQKKSSAISSLTTVKPFVRKGIIACNWPLQLPAGREWRIQGTYHNDLQQPVTLRISGFDTDMDSVVVPGGQQLPFTLKTVPVHQGRALYRIVALRGTDTLEQQPLPVEVQPLTPMAILFLSSSPDFDNRFLADWLVQQGDAVAMRTLVSRDKYATRFSGMEQQPLEKLTPAVLEKFDVVIANASAVPAEVRRYAAEAGLGLIIKNDTVSAHIQPQTLFLHGYRLPQLQTDPAAPLPVAADALPLLKDSLGRIYSTVTLSGQGKIVHTKVSNTYSWQLEGRQEAYQRYWSTMLEMAAGRKKADGFTLSILPRIDEETEVLLETSGQPEVRAGSSVLYMQQHPFLPSVWMGRYWPQRAGWQQLLASRVSRWIYVFGKDDWKNLSSLPDKAFAVPAGELTGTANAPLSPWWYIVPLLLSLAFLWWEQKI